MSPLFLLAVLVFILTRRLCKQKKCEEFEYIKHLPIARSRAESFEYISHVASEASDDALAKSCEIELDMAGGWWHKSYNCVVVVSLLWCLLYHRFLLPQQQLLLLLLLPCKFQINEEPTCASALSFIFHQ
ncbi:hypothetical protein TRVL_09578 [Trypanosoma vivax]|nr:hypothetical protein TRVL_09578 [Trypanosoma vivax]